MTTWQAASHPLVLGHRGASAERPENTLAAFALAQQQAADGVELDVHLSADGVPVVIHDRHLDRTTTGRGVVSQFTVAELKQLDAGEGETIPTLAEVFDLCGADFLYNVELKEYGWGDTGLAAATAAVMQAHGFEANCLVSSFNPLSVRRAQRVLPPQVPVAVIRMNVGLLRFGHLLVGNAAADHPHFRMVNGRYIAWAQQRGYLVNTWTVDEPDEARRLAALGVNAIITNKPDTIRAALGLS